MSLLALALAVSGPVLAGPPRPSAEELFAHRILPLLQAKCFACHGDDRDDIRGDLDMRTLAGLLSGGESGQPSLVASQPDESPLYLAVTRASDIWSPMPPKENDRLSAEQIQYLEQWIAGGAPWPDEERLAELKKRPPDRWTALDGVAVRTSGGLSNEWTYRKYDPANLWAYQPLWKDEGGRLKDAQQNPIDILINEQLKARGIQPAPSADRRTLIRRATYDLLGLPPNPDEVEAFANDPASDDVALAKLVDRLLDSPHYGEQWGRHWLDVVRYADSSGYANDYERGNAWRYRDYVIRALNDDKPYDQFIREQIAGDEIDPNDPEMLVATGFLRMGPWELTGMEVAKIARQRFLDDVTDAVGQVFLGHMLQCARCHDHKFDPVPTRDYYSIQALFATTQLADRPAPFLAGENTSGFEEVKYREQRREYYHQILSELDQKSIAAAREWYRREGIDSAPFEEAAAQVVGQTGQRGRQAGYGEIRNVLFRKGISETMIPPRHAGFTPQDYGMERVARKGLERLGWMLERYKPVALSVYDGRTPDLKSVNAPPRIPQHRMTAGELEETCILVGGNPFSPAAQVEPGVLSVVQQSGLGSVRTGNHVLSSEQVGNEVRRAGPFPTAIEGRRHALAEWISSPENPLTARVMVNRIWQWHFGQALAGNPNNFGTTGKKPSHPELLDWLAATFIEEGWSIKSLHRRIMNAAVYRRSSQHPDARSLAEKDPDGTSYAVFRARRLDAEELRDAMLRASGELNLEVGGIPIRPEINLEAALQPRQVMGTFAEAWQPSPRPEQRHRRSIYALRIRGLRDPFLEVFNAPNPDISCEAREASTVTPQVFSMFNSEMTFDRALAMADRLLKESDGREQAIDRAFQIAHSRSASPAEIDVCLAHWDTMTARHESLEFEPPTYPHEVIREAVEENTGEKFTFTEPLEVFADFVPDLKPSDANPQLRGLAEICLVLMNSNEFAYVY